MFYNIQLINAHTRKSYFFDFTTNVSLVHILNYVSDNFQTENIQYFYKGNSIHKDNKSLSAKDIDGEIYFITY